MKILIFICNAKRDQRQKTPLVEPVHTKLSSGRGFKWWEDLVWFTISKLQNWFHWSISSITYTSNPHRETEAGKFDKACMYLAGDGPCLDKSTPYPL